MQYVLSRFRIKDGMKDRAVTFLADLHRNHQAEMDGVLKDVGMTLDCSFVESTGRGDFVYIFKRLEDLSRLRGQLAKLDSGIYKKINKWAAECLEEGEDLYAEAAFDRMD